MLLFSNILTHTYSKYQLLCYDSFLFTCNCFRVDHLIEGHDYNFRVKAVNKFGESMPLAMSSPITAKDPFGKPDKPGAPEPTGEQTYCLYTVDIF